MRVHTLCYLQDCIALCPARPLGRGTGALGKVRVNPALLHVCTGRYRTCQQNLKQGEEYHRLGGELRRRELQRSAKRLSLGCVARDSGQWGRVAQPRKSPLAELCPRLRRPTNGRFFFREAAATNLLRTGLASDPDRELRRITVANGGPHRGRALKWQQ